MGRRKAEKQFVVVDAPTGAEYDKVEAPVFSADGKRMGYAAQTGRETFRGGGWPGGYRA